jgi:hypothetical protein
VTDLARADRQESSRLREVHARTAAAGFNPRQ